MRSFLKTIVLLFFLTFFIVDPVIAEHKVNVQVVLAGDWGSKEGEFGIDRSGKTELGYALDFLISKDNIYILDSINNRIQMFDLNGKYKGIIKLNFKWQDLGLPWDFTLCNHMFYTLIGKPPYYSPAGIKEVSKITDGGILVKSFGSKYIPKDKEEYFNNILSESRSGYIYCGLGGIKVLIFDADGNLKDTLINAKKGEIINLVGISSDGKPLVTVSLKGGKNRRTVVIDSNNKQIEKEIKGKFSLLDNSGNFYEVQTKSASKRKKVPMLTTIEVAYAPGNKTEKYELKGDIEFRNRIYKYTGNFLERARIDSEGNIYHLIALENGLILRKISLK